MKSKIFIDIFDYLIYIVLDGIKLFAKGREKMPMIETKNHKFTVLIEQDEDGYYVATVPALKSCYTQARSFQELYPRIKEVIELCLEEQQPTPMKFVAVHQLEISEF